MLKKLIKLFRKKNYVHIVNKDYQFIKENIKLKYIPKSGEFIYYGDNNKDIFIVTNVLYNIHDDLYHVIIMTEPFETK